MEQNEVFLAIVGQRWRRYWFGYGCWFNCGQSSEVEFDYRKVMAREETSGDIQGFWHTHPNFRALPSETDHATMSGWTICFGKPVVCCIEGIDGLRAYWFWDRGERIGCSRGRVKRIGRWFFGIIPSMV